MDRPEVITKQELQNPPAEQSASMQRGQAFAHDGVWAGFAVFPVNSTRSLGQICGLSGHAARADCAAW
jgi:hypothetical protein